MDWSKLRIINEWVLPKFLEAIIKIELDLSIYVTKVVLENAAGLDS